MNLGFTPPKKQQQQQTTNKHQQWEFILSWEHSSIEQSHLFFIPYLHRRKIFFFLLQGDFFFKAARIFFPPKIHLFLLITTWRKKYFLSSSLHIFAEAEIISRNGALKRKALLALVKTHFYSSLELYCIVPQVEVLVRYRNWADWNGTLNKRR